MGVPEVSIQMKQTWMDPGLHSIRPLTLLSEGSREHRLDLDALKLPSWPLL